MSRLCIYKSKRVLGPLLFFSFIVLSCTSEKPVYGPDIYIPDPGFKVVGYLPAGDFDKIEEIELGLLTHLCIAFANPDANGNLVFSPDTEVTAIVEKAHEAGVKVLLSLAGGGTPDAEHWKSALDSANRTDFIRKITNYVDKHDLDGIDVDIEWNLLPDLGALYTPFVLELKEALHAKGKAITTALQATNIPPDATQKSLEAYDFINIMAYDKTGPWKPENAGQHSPYSYIEDAYVFWTEIKKIPSSKLVLGLPFYGHNFDPPGSTSYRSIVDNGLENAYKDQIDQIYYNGIPTIVSKTEFAKRNFNGVMFWQLAQDKCKDDLSLLRAVNQTLQAGDCKVNIYFQDRDGDGYGDLAKPYHACEAPEGYVTNSSDINDKVAN